MYLRKSLIVFYVFRKAKSGSKNSWQRWGLFFGISTEPMKSR